MAIESMMYFALGFLLSSLVMIVILPSVWKRAVRLTKKRIEAATPITMAEFRADKDQLRAEFALSARKLERTIETLRGRLTEQLTELNTTKSNLAVASAQRDRLEAGKADLDERAKAANERIHEYEKKIADLSQQLRGRERAIADLTGRLKHDQTIDAPNVLSTPTMVDPSVVTNGKPSATRNAIASIRQAISFSDKQTFEAVEGINDAYSRISNAGSNLDALLDQPSEKANGNGRKTSLAEELSQDDAREDLRRRIKDIENSIRKDWNKGRIDKTDLRDRMDDIATSVSKLVYATDSEPHRNTAESLFDRIRKFAGDDVDSLEMPAAPTNSQQKPAGSQTLTERIAAFQDIHAGN